jgi:hypothetical protein
LKASTTIVFLRPESSQNPPLDELELIADAMGVFLTLKVQSAFRMFSGTWMPLFEVTPPIAVQRNEVLRDESDRAFPVYGDLF